jgi:hypothetical protein
MEKVDVVDEQTPTDGDNMDKLPPPVWGGYYGYPQELSYTEKVRSPITFV